MSEKKPYQQPKGVFIDLHTPKRLAYIEKLKQFQKKMCINCKYGLLDHVARGGGCCSYKIDSMGNGYPKFNVDKLTCETMVYRKRNLNQEDGRNAVRIREELEKEKQGGG